MDKKKVFILIASLAILLDLVSLVFMFLLFSKAGGNIGEGMMGAGPLIVLFIVTLLYLVIPVISLFSVRGLSSEEIYNRRWWNVLLIILNIYIIISGIRGLSLFKLVL